MRITLLGDSGIGTALLNLQTISAAWKRLTVYIRLGMVFTAKDAVGEPSQF